MGTVGQAVGRNVGRVIATMQAPRTSVIKRFRCFAADIATRSDRTSPRTKFQHSHFYQCGMPLFVDLFQLQLFHQIEWANTEQLLKFGRYVLSEHIGCQSYEQSLAGTCCKPPLPRSFGSLQATCTTYCLLMLLIVVFPGSVPFPCSCIATASDSSKKLSNTVKRGQEFGVPTPIPIS